MLLIQALTGLLLHLISFSVTGAYWWDECPKINENATLLQVPMVQGKPLLLKNFLPEEAECLNFLNADLIARGIAPFKPESVAIEAGKLFLNGWMLLLPIKNLLRLKQH